MERQTVNRGFAENSSYLNKVDGGFMVPLTCLL